MHAQRLPHIANCFWLMGRVVTARGLHPWAPPRLLALVPQGPTYAQGTMHGLRYSRLTFSPVGSVHLSLRATSYVNSPTSTQITVTSSATSRTRYLYPHEPASQLC